MSAFIVRAKAAPSVEGRPAWHGQAQYTGWDEWFTAANAAGDAICYETPDAARAGAQVWAAELAASPDWIQVQKLREKGRLT
jgi:hypothetical protein